MARRVRIAPLFPSSPLTRIRHGRMHRIRREVVLTNPAHKASGMVIKAAELAEKHGWFQPCQFESEANAWVHAQTTGQYWFPRACPVGVGGGGGGAVTSAHAAAAAAACADVTTLPAPCLSVGGR